LGKWAAFKKISYTWKNGSLLEKWVILGKMTLKMGKTWKNVLHLEE